MKKTIHDLVSEMILTWSAFDRDEPVSGADLVDWFRDWRRQIIEVNQASHDHNLRPVVFAQDGEFDTWMLEYENDEDLLTEARNVNSAINKYTWEMYDDPDMAKNDRYEAAKAENPDLTPWDWHFGRIEASFEAWTLADIGMRVLTVGCDRGSGFTAIWNDESEGDNNQHVVVR